MKNERELPIYEYGNLEFIVDVANGVLRNKSDPDSVHLIHDMHDVENGYYFQASLGRGKGTVPVFLPPLVKIDPHGMAKKYNKSLEEVKSLSDFEIMVDQRLLEKRIKFGQLPTITIADHIFYADARIDLLRPKDDFTTMGISFDELDSWYVDGKNCYAFPYDPKAHEIAKRDWEKVFEYPKDLLFVEIPDARILDPVGWNRRHGLAETYGLKETGLQLEFKAKVIPWQKSGIDELIAENKLKRPIPDLKQKVDRRNGRGQKR